MKNWSLKNFDLVYRSILLQSLNIPINQDFVNEIASNFKQGNILKFTPNDILKFNKNIQLKQYTIFVVISNQKNYFQNIQKFPDIQKQINTKQIFDYFKKCKGGYYPLNLSTNQYLFLNYDHIDKNDTLQLVDVISHQLTHLFQQKNYKWTDLIPADYNQNPIKYLYLTKVITDIVQNLQFSPQSIIELTKKQQFQAYCTSLQINKKSIDIQNIKHQFFEIDSQFDSLSQKIKTLYLFIYFNQLLDPTGLRFEYIKKHLV